MADVRRGAKRIASTRMSMTVVSTPMTLSSQLRAAARERSTGERRVEHQPLQASARRQVRSGAGGDADGYTVSKELAKITAQMGNYCERACDSDDEQKLGGLGGSLIPAL